MICAHCHKKPLCIKAICLNYGELRFKLNRQSLRMLGQFHLCKKEYEHWLEIYDYLYGQDQLEPWVPWIKEAELQKK